MEEVLNLGVVSNFCLYRIYGQEKFFVIVYSISRKHFVIHKYGGEVSFLLYTVKTMQRHGTPA